MPRGQRGGVVWQTSTTTMGPNGQQTIVRTQYSDGRVEETIFDHGQGRASSTTSSQAQRGSQRQDRRRRSARTEDYEAQRRREMERQQQMREQWQREQERMAREVRKAAWVVAKDVIRALIGRAIYRISQRISSFFAQITSFFSRLLNRK